LEVCGVEVGRILKYMQVWDGFKFARAGKKFQPMQDSNVDHAALKCETIADLKGRSMLNKQSP